MTGELGAGRPAVVAVHGGPGSTHDYLLPLARLAEDGWPVVHYDQLGNGGSTHLPGKGAEFWTVELFEQELANLVQRLGIADDYVLFGQSWGGPLCARHAMAGPPGLRGLVVANAPASAPCGCRRWRGCVPSCPRTCRRPCCGTRRPARTTARSTSPRCGSSTTATCAV